MRTSYAVGVDVGGTRVAAGLIERKGRIVKEARTLTPKEAGPFAIVDAIIDLIEDVSSSGVHPSEIAGIGVGLPAQIDFLKQSVEFCTNLPLTGVDMRSLIMSRVRHSVTIDNDSNCAGIGESRFGAGKNVRDFETELNAQGLSFTHLPASAEWATIGGSISRGPRPSACSPSG